MADHKEPEDFRTWLGHMPQHSTRRQQIEQAEAAYNRDLVFRLMAEERILSEQMEGWADGHG